MRSKFAIPVLLLALGIAVAATVTGQEDPLPTVQSRAFAIEPASIVLAVEPIRTVQQPTLADAVRRNDYVSFHALYEETKPAEYRTLHELWTWAINDRVGAFYGREMHDRLSRAYPGYASYIDAYKIVDQRGNVFYPTSETRTFLLQKALEKASPRVVIATSAPTPASTQTARRNNVRGTSTGTSSPAVTPRRRQARSTSVAKTTATTAPAKPQPKPAPAPASTSPAVATTAVATPAVAAPPTEAPVVVTPSSIDSGVGATTTQAASVPAPAVAPQVAPPVETAPVAAPPQTPETKRTPNSGILLLVIGLIGVGLLAVILRTPREATPTSILQPQAPPAEPEAKAPVEPIRRPGSGESPKPRATGSHG